jgi:hypothetical protein
MDQLQEKRSSENGSVLLDLDVGFVDDWSPQRSRGEQDCVTVRGRVRHGVERDPGSCSGSVLHDNLLMSNLRQTIRDDARSQIRSATRRKTDKDPHDARWKSIRERRLD